VRGPRREPLQQHGRESAGEELACEAQQARAMRGAPARAPQAWPPSHAHRIGDAL